MEILDKKRLIFSFYLTNKWWEHSINMFHMKMLSMYLPRFDESLFCLIVDDDIEQDSINLFQKTIISHSCGNISFKLYKNTNYRESYVLYNELATKLSKLDGLTFFGHNKGISDSFGEDNVKTWVAALYFFSFEVDLPNNGLNGPTFYGPLKSVGCNYKYTHAVQNTYNWTYCGTFFWIKAQQVDSCMKLNGVEVPKLTSRWYSEMFPGNVVSNDEAWSYFNIILNEEDINGSEIRSIIEKMYEGHYILDCFKNYCNEVF